MDRHSALVETIGEADVIGIAMGEDDSADVVERASHRPELGDELSPVTGQTGVDNGDLPRFLHEIDVDEVGTDAMEEGGKLHLWPG
jgi:hypothetical protein